MEIERHRLVLGNGAPVRFAPSPNVGGALTPAFLIMHYTAGRNAQESIDWLCSSQSRASAHLVIARDGTPTQLVPFDRVAWHAGRSSWGGLSGFNSRSIGIELDNPGPVVRGPGGRWRSYFGREYDDAEVVVARNRLTGENCGWVTYPEAQLETAVEAGRALVAAYGIETILGHEDIAPTRKTDPGPAFPMESFRARVLTGTRTRGRFVTTAELRIRGGPGLGFDPVAGSPLPVATPVQVEDEEGSWWRVDVLREVNHVKGLTGWVHSRYLQPE